MAQSDTTTARAAERQGGGGATCADGAARPGRGRPVRIDRAVRESLILDATERVLERKGLHGASMAAIAREAGMSKRTLYEVFGSRAGLFEACIRRLRTTFVRPLRDAERELPVEERLLRLLAPDLARHQSGVPIAILRAVVAEAARQPELARAFLREGPDEARRVVRDELARAAERGEIRIGNPALAASLLCDMVYENPVDRLIDPARPPASPAEMERRARLAVGTFLHGVAAARG